MALIDEVEQLLRSSKGKSFRLKLRGLTRPIEIGPLKGIDLTKNLILCEDGRNYPLNHVEEVPEEVK